MSTQISKRELSAGLGVGALALLAQTQRASADTPFSSFAFPATGAPKARTMPDRLAELKNVRDFGAVGDGVTDDSGAIQAAVNTTLPPYSSAKRGTIFFPPGLYQLKSPITFNATDGIFAISFVGVAGAKLRGNFADALLKRAPYSPLGGIYSIESLELENNNAAGKGIMLHSCVGASIRNCAIAAFRGIETYNSQSVNIDSCSISSGGVGSAVGIMAGNATMVTSTDISGCFHGIRHQNVGLTVVGGRYEANTIAIMVGMDENGGNFTSSAVHIHGLSMEANTTAHIFINAGASVNIGAVSMGGGVNMGDGLRVAGGQDIFVAGVTASVGTGKTWSGAAINVSGGTRVLLQCVCGIDGSGNPSWNVGAGVSQTGWAQYNGPSNL